MPKRLAVWFLAGIALAGLSPRSPDPRRALAAEKCPICDGTKKIPCPKCKGEAKPCERCGDKGEIVCPDCDGEGRIECAACLGTGGIPCPKCHGAGWFWVERRKVWGADEKSGKGGLRRVIPAHWERCARCAGKGRLQCERCKGKGTTPCTRCREKGLIVCPVCKGKKPDRGKCPACGGKGWIPCPACLEKKVEAGPAAPPREILRDLRWARRMLAREPLIAPLVAVAHIASLESPSVIIVLRDALACRPRWVRAMAFDELLRFDARDLAEFGGPVLVRAALAAAERTTGEAGAIALRLIEKIAARYPEALRREGEDGPWTFDASRFPAGANLLEPDPAAGDPDRDGGQGEAGRTSVGPEPSEGAAGRLFGFEDFARRGIDCVWAIDCTASVERTFEDMRSAVKRTMRLLAELFGNQRAGLIAYRDRVEGVLPLGNDDARFHEALAALHAEKGGDLYEGVDFALRQALDEKAMGIRSASHLAVVFLGEAGPRPPRAQALLRSLRVRRSVTPLLRVHAVKVGSALREPGASAFWDDLAAAGGGRAMGLARGGEMVEHLAAALVAGVDEDILRRIVRLVARLEGW
ncbi:MAG: hypothetical protein JXP34_28700 [Planctomycetes bacterium]|nr:hypothetical protein [Planctomycetota bacterium]